MATNKVPSDGQQLDALQIDLQSHEKHASQTFMTSQSKSHLPAI